MADLYVKYGVWHTQIAQRSRLIRFPIKELGYSEKLLWKKYAK